MITQNVPAALQNHSAVLYAIEILKTHVVMCKYAIGTIYPALKCEKFKIREFFEYGHTLII
jgi:hypothetical protein